MTVDHDYLELCKRIFSNGKLREDRTGTGTYSVFGERLDIDLKQGFPLLTTKRLYWKAILRELLWFISGSPDSTILSAQGVRIWEGNTSREALDSRGLHDYPVGSIGPGYGWQWRRSGATFESPVAEGVDQLQDVIKQIRQDPTSRRMIVTAWNPIDLPKMALPPCHIMYQFYVDDGELSCQMYQRSVDVGLGLPFNIASYALLTQIIAHITGLQVGRLIMCLGDTHIYTNHVEGIEEQLSRAPRPLPQLQFKREIKDIDSMTEDDIELLNYDPHPKLSAEMKMAV